MTTAQIAEVREIRRELIDCGADPYLVAAQALEQARRYRRLLEEQQAAPGSFRSDRL